MLVPRILFLELVYLIDIIIVPLHYFSGWCYSFLRKYSCSSILYKVTCFSSKIDNAVFDFFGINLLQTNENKNVI